VLEVKDKMDELCKSLGYVLEYIVISNNGDVLASTTKRSDVLLKLLAIVDIDFDSILIEDSNYTFIKKFPDILVMMGLSKKPNASLLSKYLSIVVKRGVGKEEVLHRIEEERRKGRIDVKARDKEELLRYYSRLFEEIALFISKALIISRDWMIPILKNYFGNKVEVEGYELRSKLGYQELQKELQKGFEYIYRELRVRYGNRVAENAINSAKKVVDAEFL